MAFFELVADYSKLISRKILMKFSHCGIKVTLWRNYITVSQCGNVAIFLPLRFYVKPILVSMESQNLLFSRKMRSAEKCINFHTMRPWICQNFISRKNLFFFQISCRDQWMWQTIKIVILEKRVIQEERKLHEKMKIEEKTEKEFLVLIFHDDRFKKKERKNIKLVIESP